MARQKTSVKELTFPVTDVLFGGTTADYFLIFMLLTLLHWE